jgi:hypothetical protein
MLDMSSYGEMGHFPPIRLHGTTWAPSKALAYTSPIESRLDTGNSRNELLSQQLFNLNYLHVYNGGNAQPALPRTGASFAVAQFTRSSGRAASCPTVFGI